MTQSKKFLIDTDLKSVTIKLPGEMKIQEVACPVGAGRGLGMTNRKRRGEERDHGVTRSGQDTGDTGTTRTLSGHLSVGQ